VKWIKRGYLCLVLSLLLIAAVGCGKEAQPELTTAAPVNETTLINDYVEAYREVDYQKMWKFWPADAFGGKVSILADMKKDIFKNAYGKAKLTVARSRIIAGSEEDVKKIVSYFSSIGINYVTDVYRTDYLASISGGKKDGKKYKRGTIYAFKYGGKWFVYDE